ncbi:MAG: GTPase domain-containing protein [Planctomycetaceae bacterium]|jgi:hypothetical protein|nr:GTPase domain-containing protein [Planctomycetaceae bacterium]
MTSRAEKIDQIIVSRKPISEKTEKTIEQLRNVEGALNNVSALLLQVAQKEIPAEQKDKAKTLQEEVRKILDEKIPQSIRELAQLQRRFSRPTLNIGVAGNARQGKSTFLQALTGLTSDEIPSAAEGHCTGAPSVIVNHTETYADIEFFTDGEFLREVILPFYSILGLSPQPVSFHSFANSPLPQPSKQLNATEEELYKKLNDRQARSKEYQNLLNQSPKRINKEQIREYIAQQDNNGNLLASWIAVKMATIYCPFKVQDAGRISVCDTPGLGDFVCGAEDNLVHNIANNIDAALMLKRVPNGGIVAPTDTQLYDLIPKAIPELSPKDWSHFIINRKDTDTDDSVKYFEKQLSESTIKVRRTITLNAVKQEDVLANFNTILEDIAGNQRNLDDTLYQVRYEKVKTLIAEVQTLAKELGALFPAASGDQEGFMQAIAMFNHSVWGNLCEQLTDLVEEWKKRRDLEHPQFIDNLNELQKELQTIPGMPTEAELEKSGKVLGKPVAHTFYCQAIRRNIVSSFDRMDLGFKQFFDELRDEAKKCFTAEDGGKLGKVVFAQDNAETKSWWASLADEIALVGTTEQSKGIANRIATAISNFENASLSFRGFLLPRILPCLDVLDTDSLAHGPYRYKAGGTEETLAQIEAAAKSGIYEACSAIQGYAKEPSMSLFATIDELRDAVTRTGNAVVAGQVWSNFYAEHRSEVWSETFQKKEADIKFRKEWQNAVDALNEKVKHFV